MCPILASKHIFFIYVFWFFFLAFFLFALSSDHCVPSHRRRSPFCQHGMAWKYRNDDWILCRSNGYQRDWSCLSRWYVCNVTCVVSVLLIAYSLLIYWRLIDFWLLITYYYLPESFGQGYNVPTDTPPEKVKGEPWMFITRDVMKYEVWSMVCSIAMKICVYLWSFVCIF